MPPTISKNYEIWTACNSLNDNCPSPSNVYALSEQQNKKPPFDAAVPCLLLFLLFIAIFLINFLLPLNLWSRHRFSNISNIIKLMTLKKLVLISWLLSGILFIAFFFSWQLSNIPLQFSWTYQVQIQFGENSHTLISS